MVWPWSDKVQEEGHHDYKRMIKKEEREGEEEKDRRKRQERRSEQERGVRGRRSAEENDRYALPVRDGATKLTRGKHKKKLILSISIPSQPISKISQLGNGQTGRQTDYSVVSSISICMTTSWRLVYIRAGQWKAGEELQPGEDERQRSGPRNEIEERVILIERAVGT